MLNLPQNLLKKSLLCVPIFSFYTYLLAEVPQYLWHSWGDFLEGCLKLPGMEAAQSLPLLLLPFRKNICENSNCAHFQACCYINKQNCCWVGLLTSQFCHLSVGKNIQKKCIPQGCLEQHNLEKFPICYKSIKCENVEFSSLWFGWWRFKICSLPHLQPFGQMGVV